MIIDIYHTLAIGHKIIYQSILLHHLNEKSS